MDGYKIVYRELGGTITETFFSKPISNLSLHKSCNMDLFAGLMFSLTYPNREIISIERCTFEEFTK
jgi:hypothetical protein